MLRKNKYLILLSILIIAFLFSFYSNVLLNPNSYLFGSEGDGMKNYYTYAYFINCNSNNIEFEGMNYPYHENMMYTDCHPALAFSLKIINRYFPILSSYSIGILNFLMILSIAITAFLLYFIFVKLKVNALLSVIGSIAITILSPQIFRITGHLALSYSFFIPLTIYLILLFEENKKRKKVFVFITISTLLLFFTHAYLGMIASLLIFTYAGLGLINQYLLERKYTQTKYFLLIITSIIPVVFFYIFIKIIDNHVGRTTNPWGIFENHAELASVFLPYFNGPLIGIKNNYFNHLNLPWEGNSYIGATAILGLFSIFVISVIFLFKKGFKTNYNKWNINLSIIFLIVSSVFILLLATLLPFRSTFYKVVDHINMLKQFRAIGRFAWVFFFVANIGAIVVLNKFFVELIKRKKRFVAYFILFLFPVFIFLEGVGFHNYTSKEIKKSSNLFDIQQTANNFQKDCKSINPELYQAIIPLPFFYVGSENFGKEPAQSIFKLTLLFSYHLKLPTTASFLTRTSIQESKNIMQLLASNFYSKNIEHDIKSEKPFLIVCSNENLNDAELNLLNKSKKLLQRDEYSIYEIGLKALFKNNAAKEYENYIVKKDQLFYKNNFMVSDTSLYFSYVDFDQFNALSFGKENGCYQGFQKGYNHIYSIQANKLDTSRQYIARFWMYNNGVNFGQDCLNVIAFFQKVKDDQCTWLEPYLDARTSFEINGDWSLIEVPLNYNEKDFSYDLIMKGNDRSELSIYFDQLLVYDSKLEVYRIDEISNQLYLFHNNHQFLIPE